MFLKPLFMMLCGSTFHPAVRVWEMLGCSDCFYPAPLLLGAGSREVQIHHQRVGKHSIECGKSKLEFPDSQPPSHHWKTAQRS